MIPPNISITLPESIADSPEERAAICVALQVAITEKVAPCVVSVGSSTIISGAAPKQQGPIVGLVEKVLVRKRKR